MSYSQTAYAPIDDTGANQYMLNQHSTMNKASPVKESSVCVWDATGHFFCEGTKIPNGSYLRSVSSGSAMLFEGFSAEKPKQPTQHQPTAHTQHKQANEKEGFCDTCSVDVPLPFQ